MAETIFALIILSLVVASIAWTVTQEEVFSEFHDYCQTRCDTSTNIAARKFFYLFTCEYCFSHWVTVAVLLVTQFHLIYEDWRGLVLAFFTIPWLANQWMSIYRRLRIEIKHKKALAEEVEQTNEQK
jgi:hypothetical protein